MKNKKHSRHKRFKSGFSLVTVLSFAMLAGLLLVGSLAAVLPIYRNTSNSGNSAIARAGAESAIDYVMTKLNTPAQRSTYDADFGKTKMTVLNGVALNTFPSLQAQLTVANLVPPTTVDPLLTQNSTTPFSESGMLLLSKWSMYSSSPTTNYWRVLTATATYGGTVRSVQAIVKPMAPSALPVYSTTSIPTPPSSTPLFTGAAFGTELVNLGSGSRTDAYDANGNTYSQYGDIGSNGSIQLGGGSSSTRINGNVKVASSPQNATDFTATLINQGNVTVNDTVKTNSNIRTNSSTGLPEFTDSFFSRNVNNVSGSNPAVQPRANLAQTQLPPATTASATATNLGDLSITSNASITAGDYIVSSINISSSGSLSVTPVSTSSGQNSTARFFLSSNAGADTGTQVQINGNVNASGKASNFQLFGDSSAKVNLTGTNTFVGTVYTPNADVYIGNNTGSTRQNIYGSVTGKQIQGLAADNKTPQAAKNARIHFDRTLFTNSGSSSGINQYRSLRYDPTAYSNPATTKLYVSSWRELTPS